jgi:hypothetical protein
LETGLEKGYREYRQLIIGGMRGLGWKIGKQNKSSMSKTLKSRYQNRKNAPSAAGRKSLHAPAVKVSRQYPVSGGFATTVIINGKDSRFAGAIADTATQIC